MTCDDPLRPFQTCYGGLLSRWATMRASTRCGSEMFVLGFTVLKGVVEACWSLQGLWKVSKRCHRARNFLFGFRESQFWKHARAIFWNACCARSPTPRSQESICFRQFIFYIFAIICTFFSEEMWGRANKSTGDRLPKGSKIPAWAGPGQSRARLGP